MVLISIIGFRTGSVGQIINNERFCALGRVGSKEVRGFQGEAKEGLPCGDEEDARVRVEAPGL